MSLCHPSFQLGGAAILILARSPVIPAWMPESSAMDGHYPVAQVLD